MAFNLLKNIQFSEKNVQAGRTESAISIFQKLRQKHIKKIKRYLLQKDAGSK